MTAQGVPGFDFSRFQHGEIDFQKAYSAGMRFCYGKASEGLDYADPTYHLRAIAARNAGLVVGAYGFARPKDDPVTQAHYLMAAAYIRTPIFYVVDFEWTTPHNDWDDLTPQQCGAFAEAYLDEIQDAKRTIPFLYTAPAFAAKYFQTVPFGVYKMLPAVYGKDVPAGYRNAAMFQRSADGNVDGIPGPVDLDYFQGSLEDLQALCVV